MGSSKNEHEISSDINRITGRRYRPNGKKWSTHGSKRTDNKKHKLFNNAVLCNSKADSIGHGDKRSECARSIINEIHDKKTVRKTTNGAKKNNRVLQRKTHNSSIKCYTNRNCKIGREIRTNIRREKNDRIEYSIQCLEILLCCCDD